MFTCDVLIENCTRMDSGWNAVPDSYIAIQSDRIAEVGTGRYRGSARVVVDGARKLFLPGLVDGHSHVCQTLLRGRILDELPMIWTRIMLPFESSLTPEIVEVGAELACLEMIKSGTTTFADAGGLHMQKVAAVVEKAGLRAALTHSTIDMGNAPPTMKFTADEAIAKNDALFDQYHGAADGRIQVFYSVRSMLSCTQELTMRVFERARERGTGVHAHMSEYPGEVMSCLEHHGMRPLEYYDSLGLLGENFLAAHGILLSAEEIALAGERGVKVVHCPFSNCGKGVPPTPQLLQQGVGVGLGTDGAAHGGLSLWNEMKIFRSVLNAHIGAPGANPVIMPAKTILGVATRGGAQALGLGGDLGDIAVGRKADLISIRLDQPHLAATSSLANTLLETANAGDVQDMIVNGSLVMHDRAVLTLDEERILSRAQALHARLFNETTAKGKIA